MSLRVLPQAHLAAAACLALAACASQDDLNAVVADMVKTLPPGAPQAG